MGIVDDIVKNKEELILKMLDVAGGKETSARVNLDGVAFNIGKSKVSLEGHVTFTLVPDKKK